MLPDTRVYYFLMDQPIQVENKQESGKFSHQSFREQAQNGVNNFPLKARHNSETATGIDNGLSNVFGFKHERLRQVKSCGHLTADVACYDYVNGYFSIE